MLGIRSIRTLLLLPLYRMIWGQQLQGLEAIEALSHYGLHHDSALIAAEVHRLSPALLLANLADTEVVVSEYTLKGGGGVFCLSINAWLRSAFLSFLILL